MGIDLSILPGIRPDRRYAVARLELDRDEPLFALVRELPSLPIEEAIWIYREDGAYPTTGDDDEEPLIEVTAGSLADAFERQRDTLTQTNRAIHAFVAALPSTRRLVLYWS